MLKMTKNNIKNFKVDWFGGGIYTDTDIPPVATPLT